MTHETKHILVVDDDIDMADSLADILTFKGNDVDVAHSGTEAIARCASAHYDLVLMDVQMPGMSGIETYHRLQESHSELHVVFITGTGSEELINRMKTETVLDVIYKPLDISKILNLVDAIGPRGKVLVADADPDYALEVSHLLVAHDFDSDTATNARMVLEKLRCEDVNLLVLDLSLPGFTDPEICVALTEDIERQHPTVLISGYPAEGEEIGQKAIENLIRLSSAKRITGHPAPIALVALIEEYDGKTRGDPKHGL